MDEHNHRTRTGSMNTWRAGCSGSCTSGSEGGPEKPTHRKMGRALRSDPYIYVPTWSGMAYVCFIVDVFSRITESAWDPRRLRNLETRMEHGNDRRAAEAAEVSG